MVSQRLLDLVLLLVLTFPLLPWVVLEAVPDHGRFVEEESVYGQSHFRRL